MKLKQHESSGCFNGNATPEGRGHPYNFKAGLHWGMHETVGSTSNYFGFASGAGAGAGWGEPDGYSCGGGSGVGDCTKLGEGVD